MLVACNTSDDYFKKFNQKPEITIKGINDGSFSRRESDSIKIKYEYHLYYQALDVRGVKLPVYVNCDSHLSYEIDDEKIVISAHRTGKRKFILSTKDIFGATDQLTIDFECFENLKPVAILEIEDIPGFRFEKKLNASKSYDQDEKYGGKISLYRFIVNKKEIDKTYHSEINYTFPLSGEYKIELQVRDNDNTWSDVTHKILIIN